ncbi:unnamed protein product [Effrenium voratum]|uniref:RRM domain-containing protein n=1 Tax=Effrenium voratum TaxID=2562239 RepID=A0AA36IBY5_9DINO|nr:unnamed protein product [Effrenium voratum]
MRRRPGSGARSPRRRCCAARGSLPLPWTGACKNEAAEVSSQEDMASSTTASHHEFWDPEETRTSMMIKNLPSTLSGQALKDLIDNEGFNASYDFLYLPMKFISKQPFGYAFVNLISADLARDFWVHFDGFHLHGSTLAMSWSTDIQGIDQHIARYRNSPVMHPSVPEECKPWLLKDGQPIIFPAPTVRIKAPKCRA